MPFAAGQRLQLNTAGPLPDGAAPINGEPANIVAAASAAAILKVIDRIADHATFTISRQVRQWVPIERYGPPRMPGTCHCAQIPRCQHARDRRRCSLRHCPL